MSDFKLGLLTGFIITAVLLLSLLSACPEGSRPVKECMEGLSKGTHRIDTTYVIQNNDTIKVDYIMVKI